MADYAPVDLSCEGRVEFELNGRRVSAPAGTMLVDAAYAFLRESQAGYDQFFFDWYGGVASEARAKASPASALYEGAAFEKLKGALEGYAPSRPEALSEAYFQRAEPCSLLIDEIEAIWAFIDAKDPRPRGCERVTIVR